MIDYTRLNGEQIRLLVLDAMSGDVTAEQYRSAETLEWPIKPKIIGTSMKVRKGEKKNAVLTGIIYMSPQKESVPYGGRNFCPFASVGCVSACLGVNCARFKMNTGLNSKLWKSVLWVWRPDIFKSLLCRDLKNLQIRAKSKKLQAACRPNGTSDIIWETKFPEMFEEFPRIHFYDYTKIEARFSSNLPSNYHLTFSRSETNHAACLRILQGDHNVAAVFSNLPKAVKDGWNGHPVFNADLSDYRPDDPAGVAGLSIKGFAKDETGFIIKNGEAPKRKRKTA